MEEKREEHGVRQHIMTDKRPFVAKNMLKGFKLQMWETYLRKTVDLPIPL